MAQADNLALALVVFGAGWVVFSGQVVRAQDSTDTRQQLKELQQQNALLQEQLRKQQTLIESLSRQVGEIKEANDRRGRELDNLQSEMKDPSPQTKDSASLKLGKVSLSGEGGVAFFNTGSEGMFPNKEFRLDEARLFIEAPIVDEVYVYTELNLVTREEPDVQLRLGEAYLDFESVSRLWNCDHQLSVRLGRIYTPFGEEYQTRYAIDNPLISHSLSDLWAVDEGLELYGRAGKFTYAVAVQNGGLPDTRDFDSDKSVAGRIGFDPSRWLHLSVSGMRTGNLDVNGDFLSAMWFGNGFFRSLGSPGTTKFHADLVEGDLLVRLPHGHLTAFGGYIHYNDNDPSANNRRDVYYYSLEGTHDVVGKLYAGVRFSQIFAHNGFPIVGNGEFANYFFNTLTEEIWRLSLGLGYRWNQNLVLKAEYSFERGKEASGEQRDHEDLFAVEAAFRF
jgi:uncharacterized coiled-coil protein SlyX